MRRPIIAWAPPLAETRYLLLHVAKIKSNMHIGNPSVELFHLVTSLRGWRKVSGS